MALKINMALLWLSKRRKCYSSLTERRYNRILDILDSKPVGKSLIVKGWVRSVRKMKGLVFVDVNDGSCMKSLQALISKSKEPSNMSYGSSVSLSGTLKKSVNGQLELDAEKSVTLGQCNKDHFPFTRKQKHSGDYTRQYLHLRPRTDTFASLLRVRHAATMFIHDFFTKNDFIHIHTPILTSNDCEGAGEIFTVQPENKILLAEMEKTNIPKEDSFFSKKAFLTVSGQLHLETIARALSKAYTFGPTFRAENSKSRLHLSEFYMIEAEEAFVESLQEILVTIESLVKQVTETVCSRCQEDLELVLKYNDVDVTTHLNTLQKIIDKPFTIMQYDEAFSILQKNDNQLKSNLNYLSGFTKEQELFLVDYNDGVPVFVIDWPKEIKPFYMKETKYDSKKVYAVDLLVPNVGELCGGSLREDNHDLLKIKLEANNLLNSLQWYLDLRKFGNVPTGGFGLGFERYLQFIMQIGNIKDTIPFPRWPHNLSL